MLLPEEFFFDNRTDKHETSGTRLPHWHQPDKVQFVTMRLADSLPQTVIAEIKKKLETTTLNASATQQNRQHKIINQLLDNGYGSCVLSHPGVRKRFSDCLWYNNDKKYRLLSYVIMPNHVHILFIPKDEHNISTIIQSLKRVSAKHINLLTQNQSKLWQKSITTP